jgi:threonine dehydratase
MELLSHEGVRAAASVLQGVANRTPVFRSRTLDARLGGAILFKGEHLQRGGAFKFRGAYHALSRLDAAARERGVLTFSSGNHAGGLALAGSLLGIPVTVAMPWDALPLKRDATAGYGAEIVECEAAEREQVGRRIAAERGLTVIPPYDDEAIIAGAGTAGLELLEEAGALDVLLAPIGGGGLLAGTALAASEVENPPKVIGVEPANADDACRSMRAGRIITLERVPDTIADGLRPRFIGERNFRVFQKWLEDIVTVTEEEIVDALRWLWIRMKLVVEPSGAVPLAALLCGRVPASGKRVGVILSGGNADPAQVGRLIEIPRTD